MSIYKKEIQRILDASKNNALTFFVGAGVSALSDAPSWKELIHSICDELGCPRKESYSSDEFLQIPQMYYYSIKEDKKKYLSFIRSKIERQELIPNAIHREMLRLNPVSFITTNYDSLLEDATSDQCQSYKVISIDSEVPKIFGDRYILKIHGDFRNGNIVLKEEDYLNYSDNFKLIETIVKSVFATNTIVFVGYGLNDYNIKMILNWTKSLLNDSFRKPIFFHISDTLLTKEELAYHQSRGLSVIESKKLTELTDYPNKYQSLFQAIKKQSAISIDGKNEEEAFSMLYTLLSPLDRLNALRTEDVSKRLNPYVKIKEDGCITNSPEECILIKRFFEIVNLSNAEQNDLPSDILKRYNTILSVFAKARICFLENDHKIKPFIESEIIFADKNCITFNYSEMHRFCAKNYKKYQTNYKKAFYLSRLSRYDESFFLFYEVAIAAFKEKDYLTYYLSKTNCIRLKRAISNLHQWNGCYDIEKIEDALPSEEVDKVFELLPIEFRNEYEDLKEIQSVNLLYRYSYESFVAGLKMQNAFDTNSIEFGLTSSGKAICRINDYLHFFLGNGILCDIFSEYKNTVRNLMTQLIHKYAIQGKEKMNPSIFDNSSSDVITLDEIDFYCIISCFKYKEIQVTLDKYSITTIEFRNIDKIECSICNLISYYEQLIKSASFRMTLNDVELKIKTALVLLRYMEISQSLVDKITTFIMSREFGDIYINEKILFLERQLVRRKHYSQKTTKVIEERLIQYISSDISAYQNKKEFSVLSTNTGIGYANLVYYISPLDDNYQSQKLSNKVGKIINNRIEKLYPDVVNYYYHFVSKYQKQKIVFWAKEILLQKFDIDIFSVLIDGKARINNCVISQLVVFLREEAEKDLNKKGIATSFSGVDDSFMSLKIVGVWCFLDKIKKSYFKEFLGYCAMFDFFYKKSKFDFERFEVRWLLNFSTALLKKITENKTIKNKVRVLIVNVLQERRINDSEYRKLNKILIDYFC